MMLSRSCIYGLGCRLFGVGNGGEEAEEGVDVGDFEGVEDAIVDGDQGEGASAFTVADVGADEGADARGIDVRDAAEVDDKEAVFLGAQGGLKLEEGRENHGSVQTDNTLAGLGTGEVLDGEGFLRCRRHPAILAVGAGGKYYRNVNFGNGVGAKRELGRLSRRRRRRAGPWPSRRVGSRAMQKTLSHSRARKERETSGEIPTLTPQ